MLSVLSIILCPESTDGYLGEVAAGIAGCKCSHVITNSCKTFESHRHEYILTPQRTAATMARISRPPIMGTMITHGSTLSGSTSGGGVVIIVTSGGNTGMVTWYGKGVDFLSVVEMNVPWSSLF